MLTTYSFKLNINGHVYGKFAGKKGLRQGDPISPLIFVLVMDYLTRMLLFKAKLHPFRFHPLCKSLKLVNLCFADDLMIFCKGHIPIVKIIMEAIQVFSSATGLHANTQKSQVCMAGIPEDKQQ